MCRRWSNRIFHLIGFALLFYIVWAILRDQRPSRDAAEDRAYRQAIRTSASIIQNTHLCPPHEMDMVIVIISASAHFLKRQSIRETWC